MLYMNYMNKKTPLGVLICISKTAITYVEYYSKE